MEPNLIGLTKEWTTVSRSPRRTYQAAPAHDHVSSHRPGVARFCVIVTLCNSCRINIATCRYTMS